MNPTEDSSTDKSWESGAETEARKLLEVLSRRCWTLVLAESCTGGLVSAAVSSIPGASDNFWGAVVSYANEAKERVLMVPRSTIEDYGAVSAQTVQAMARGSLLLSGADLAAAVSGIAGPGGGSPEKPVGTVWIGIASKEGGSKEVLLSLTGGREQIREAAASRVLQELRIFAEYGNAVLP